MEDIFGASLYYGGGFFVLVICKLNPLFVQNLSNYSIMNKLLSLSVLATTLLLSSCNNAPQEEPLAKVIDRGLKASTEQALLMAKDLEQQEGRQEHQGRQTGNQRLLLVVQRFLPR